MSPIARVLLIWMVAISSAQGAAVVLQPSKDNTLFQQSNPAAQLSNGQGDIFVGRTNQDVSLSIRRGLVAFDLTSIPASSTITSVSLTMRDVMGVNGDPAIHLHRLTQDWGEGASVASGGGGGTAALEGDATWLYRFFNAADPPASPAWTTPGGDYSPTSSGFAVIADDLGPGQLFTWDSSSNPLMVADVQHWLDNPGANFGWLLLGDESRALSAKRLNSGEAQSPNVPPVLTIEYIPEPSTLVTTLLGLSFSPWMVSRLRRGRPRSS